MKLTTLVIDDEPIALEKLKGYVEKVPFLTLANACPSGFDAVEYLADNAVDLIITDINMPDLSGLDFIKSMANPPLVIFTTAYPQYAVDSYKVNAVDYLLKPYGFVDFQKAVHKALEFYSSKIAAVGTSQDDALFVKTDYRYVRVPLADIRFIKGYGEYLQLYVAGNTSPLLTLSSFAAIKAKLTPVFLQIHRSYIVNMNHVQQVERGRVVMDKENAIPVGDSFKATLQEFLRLHGVGKK